MKKFFFMVLILLCGCKDNLSHTSFVINSTASIMDENTNLSSIVTIKNIIPLETNDNSVIGNLGKILKVKNRIYVLFNRNTLLVFDEKGKFLQKIGSLGQGPGEYQLIGDFDVVDDAIYLRDYQKLHQYNLQGKFIRTIPFDVNLFGINVVDEKILGFVTRDEHVSHVFTLEGDCINKEFPESKAATIGVSNYYWPYMDTKYIFPFANSNDALIYDYKKDNYETVKLVDLPDMLSLDDINRLYDEKGSIVNLREYGRIVWPFNSNLSQMFFITSKGEEKGILWVKDKILGIDKSFNCEYLINDVLFTDIKHFFSGYTRSNNSFLAYIMPYTLKEALSENEKWYSESPYYQKMKELANSLSDEDNPIIIEYEFK